MDNVSMEKCRDITLIFKFMKKATDAVSVVHGCSKNNLS